MLTQGELDEVTRKIFGQPAKSPCGHSPLHAWSQDGGKTIICLMCARNNAEDLDALCGMPAYDYIRQLRFALSMLRRFNMAGNFDSSVVMTVREWIDAGMNGPVPWPDSPFFADWAYKQGWENIKGFVGLRRELKAKGPKP